MTYQRPPSPATARQRPAPDDPPWPPRRSPTAVTALVLGVLAIPLGLTIYLGLLAGVLAFGFGIAGLVGTRHGRASGRGMAVAGLVTAMVGLIISITLGAYGMKTFRDCQDEIGHRPNRAELAECLRDGS